MARLDGEAQGREARAKRPPLIASDADASRHDGEPAGEGRRAAGGPLAYLLVLVGAVAGAAIASSYRVTWALLLLGAVAAVDILMWASAAARGARARDAADVMRREEQLREYRRDLEATLVGYDVDRGMTQAEIDALVDEYRHYLDVRDASLLSASPMAIFKALAAERRKERQARRKARDKGRGGMRSDG